MSSANRVDLRYIKEVVYGTTPANPALKLVRMTSESLNENIQTVQSQEIRNDRNIQDLIPVAERAGGGIEFEHSATSFDDLLENVMGATWVVDGVDPNKFTLVNGTTLSSFTFSKRLSDISQYFVYTGARINTARLQVRPGALVTGSFGVMARGAARASAQIAGATTPVGATTRPYTGGVDVTVQQIDGAALPAALVNYTLNINNNIRETPGIGFMGPTNLVPGAFEVTGDLEMYFEEATFYDKMPAGTAFAFAISMTDDVGNIFRIDVPRAKLETSEVVTQGQNTDVMLRATYRGLYHAATLGTLKLTKDAP